jgi:hypothetical protein
MRLLTRLIILVYCTGFANELAIINETRGGASMAGPIKSMTQQTIRSLEWPVSALGRIIVRDDGVWRLQAAK